MVTRTWTMGSILLESPTGWQNFIHDLEQRIPDMEYVDGGFSIETLNKELEPYHARYYEHGHNSFVDFYNDKCYTLFVMKYGGKK